MVDIIRLFSAITDDSPSNRQSMLQISGALAGMHNISVAQKYSFPESYSIWKTTTAT